MSNRAMPTAQEIAKLLSDLLDREVTTKTLPPAALGNGPALLASYGEAGGEVVALLVCDVAAAASLGAALSMLPAGRAEESVRAGALDEFVMENFREICNVVTRLVNRPVAPGMPLQTVTLREVDIRTAGDIAALTAQFRARIDVEVNVPGYQIGSMSLLTF